VVAVLVVLVVVVVVMVMLVVLVVAAPMVVVVAASVLAVVVMSPPRSTSARPCVAPLPGTVRRWGRAGGRARCSLLSCVAAAQGLRTVPLELRGYCLVLCVLLLVRCRGLAPKVLSEADRPQGELVAVLCVFGRRV
jgi:hypothetical protein